MPHNMAPIMFASLIVFLLLGYPATFSLAAVGLVYFVVGVEIAPVSRGEISLSWPLLQSLPERLYGIMNNDVLLAIPFFTFMGLVLERSGMAEDLLDTIGQLFGTVRGGLAYAVVFVGIVNRRCCRICYFDGPYLAADHAALWLRPSGGLWCHRRLRDASPDHPALPGADRHGGSAWAVGWRHVRRRVYPRIGACMPLPDYPGVSARTAAISR